MGGMNNTQKKVRKVVVTLALTKEAQDIIFDYGYASQRTVGAFVSQLIVEHHARVSRKPSKEEIAVELHRLADLLPAAE